MNKIRIVTAVLFLMFAVACGNNTSKPVEAKPDSVPMNDNAHNAENSLDYYGIYSGTVPSSNGSNVNMTVTLNADKSFVLETNYRDNMPGLYKSEGTYIVQGNLLTINNEKVSHNFRIEENRIRLLDKDNKPIEGTSASLYILNKQ